MGRRGSVRRLCTRCKAARVYTDGQTECWNCRKKALCYLCQQPLRPTQVGTWCRDCQDGVARFERAMRKLGATPPPDHLRETLILAHIERIAVNPQLRIGKSDPA